MRGQSVTQLPFPLKKVGFKWGGGSGGVRTTNSLGDAFIGQNNGVQQTNQPLEVGYANRPSKGGVCGVFPYMQACWALI